MEAQSKSSSGKAVAAASASYEEMKAKRAWDLAVSPAKSLPMQAFMLYMSGGGVQIFSMGIVFMLLSSPFKNLASINTSTSDVAASVTTSLSRYLAFAQFAPASSSPKALSTLPAQKIALRRSLLARDLTCEVMVTRLFGAQLSAPTFFALSLDVLCVESLSTY